MTEPGTSVEIVEIPVEATYDLRRRVLRVGTPSIEFRLPEDTWDGAFHLGAVTEGGTVVAVASFVPRPTSLRPGRAAVQLRAMAVEPERQRTGAGRVLFAAAIERLRAEGVEVVWADARDSALGFYRRAGMEAVGDGYVTEATGLPHHTVVLDL
jgi:GNAT superfamily N-acetyltransferase